MFAQGSARGTILDDKSEALPGAYVFLNGTDFRGLTSIDGEYAIHNIPAGEYELVISYIGYSNLTQKVMIEDGKTTITDISLNESVMLDEIVINGRLEGQAKALNTQKNKLNITEIIASEQIERFPDANLGDALKRLAGINVQYDQGEARFANIRGTAPELNSITINGERIPSAEAEKRFVQLDLIPADVIGTIEVNKAVTPDMDGDAIGGSINLVTQKATPGSKFKGTLGSGYSFLTQKPLLKGKLQYSNRFADNKLGLILNASILDKQTRSDNVETEWEYEDENNQDGTAYTSDFQIRQYRLERLRQSYSATLDYQITPNHNVYVTGMYNWRNDWENRYRLRFKDIEQDDDGQWIAEIRRQTKGGVSDNKYGRLEDQKMQTISGGGEHFFNKVKVKWTLSSLQASEHRPNERYISMRAKDVPVSFDITDPSVPILNVLDNTVADLNSEYGLKELTEEFKETEEKDFNGRLDVEFPILYGKNSSSLKVGGRFKMKSKYRDNSFKEYEPTDEDAFVSKTAQNIESQTEDNFSVGDYTIGSFVTREYLGDLDLTSATFEGENVLEEFAGNFEAKENVVAAYAMYTQNIGDKWRLLGGLRFENTSVNNKGNIFDGDDLTETSEQSDSYNNILPGLHIKFSPSQWTNLRFAATSTLARPNYYDLIPYQEIDPDDNNIKVGNASLEATTSTNIDLLAEHYFKNLGIISGGIFYKNLDNVIAKQTINDYSFNGNTYDKFSQPVNLGGATLFGFEVGLQRRLDFLPGVLGNTSLYLNYTYNQSELVDITLADREDEALPLVGTPNNTFNASLAYDAKKLDIRVSYSFADSFIEEYGDEAFYDRWYDSVNYLDFNVDYKMTDNWKLYLSINNILDQPLRYYQGVENRNMQVEYYGVSARIGVKFKY